MKKIFFIDIDDTLLPTSSEGISQENIDAVTDLNKKHDVYIATGKSHHMAKDILKLLSINKAITSNGSYIHENSQPIYSNPILKEDIDIIKEMISNYDNIVLGGQSNNGSYFLNPTSSFDSNYIEDIFVNLTVPIPKWVDDFEEDVYQLWLLGEIDDFILENEKFNTFRWHDNGLDIVYKDTSKASGITYLLNTKYKGQDIKTYAFGDSLNDIAMFELVDESIAMSTGHKDLISKSKYITDNSENKGIYNYLVKKNLIK